jgi:hypothetical protein
MPTADQLRQLKHAAEQNAEDLTADARVLLDAGRFPRAYALAVLALEELGKAQLCHDGLYVEPNPEHPGGPPRTPSEVSGAQATEMVTIAEEVTLGAASHDWVIPYG